MSETTKPAAREGSLDAPFRHPIEWRDEAYYDLAAVEAEMERQFDVCHTCRRCFNLCDSFPRLFDMIDESKTGELDSVPTSNSERTASSIGWSWMDDVAREWSSTVSNFSRRL